jgi:hypothetical protein
LGGGRSEYGVFDRGREEGGRENREFRGCTTIDGVAQLGGLSEGIYSHNRLCDKSGSRVRGGVCSKRGYRGSERRSRKRGFSGLCDNSNSVARLKGLSESVFCRGGLCDESRRGVFYWGFRSKRGIGVEEAEVEKIRGFRVAQQF